jgi:hypothetical protein
LTDLQIAAIYRQDSAPASQAKSGEGDARRCQDMTLDLLEKEREAWQILFFWDREMRPEIRPTSHTSEPVRIVLSARIFLSETAL